MRIVLVNPSWSYERSIYFGCREPHLPLEFGYTRALLERDGHDVLVLDGQLSGSDNRRLAGDTAAFAPDMTVVATAPTYLFWRCAPPELRCPMQFLAALGRRGGTTIAVGPHGSATPGAALRKLGVDIVLRGECEEVVAALARDLDPAATAGTAWLADGEPVINGPPAAARFVDLPALAWPDEWIARHRHHHHRFDDHPDVPGAEVEASRGCPYSCSFCAKIDYRDKYRRRNLDLLLAEIDGLLAQGARYLYFIDEIFLPQKPLLEALAARDVEYGVQTRIDLWSEPMLQLLGESGCVSVEAGVESLTVEGRAALDKKCRMTTEELRDRLIAARRWIPFVQANLIETPADEEQTVAAWREALRRRKVWANDPVPLYPYPSSPDYRRLWGAPDDEAWERAHRHYLDQFDTFSDIQEQRPAPLSELEGVCAAK